MQVDAPEEWYYCSDEQTLYYMPNATGSSEPRAPAGLQEGVNHSVFVATKLKVLINISGSKEAPAHHLAIRGLVLRDTAYTYLDPQCVRLCCYSLLSSCMYDVVACASVLCHLCAAGSRACVTISITGISNRAVTTTPAHESNALLAVAVWLHVCV